MNRLVRSAILLGNLLLATAALPPTASAQTPTPDAFVRNLDVRCYRIPPGQAPLGITLRLDQLNPVLAQVPPQNVVVQAAQDLCVPVSKDDEVPPPDVLPFLKYVDWTCYGITGPSLDLPLHLDHLNPVIVKKLGPGLDVTVREPQQLCVPVIKNNVSPPKSVASLVSFLDVECYRLDPFAFISVVPIRLTHLNPLFADLAPEDVALEGPGVPQLCVPVMKNQRSPSRQFFNHIRFSDVLCYAMQGLPLNRQLTLTHLNPVLSGMGLPPENVYVTDSDRLCVPVAKNGLFPPEGPLSATPLLRPHGRGKPLPYFGLGRTCAARPAELDCQKRGGDGEKHGIANDANVSDLHIGQRHTNQAGKRKRGACEKQLARNARDTGALNSSRGE
jgi:hypothetical protein